MPCDSIQNCTTNPISNLPAASWFLDIGNVAFFIINLVFVLAYSALVIYVLFNLFSGIYRLIFADDQKTFEIVRESAVRVLVGTVGLVALTGALWLLSVFLALLGVPDAENIFKHLPF